MTDLFKFLVSDSTPSDVWIIFWVLIVTAVIFTPFGMYGIMRVWRWIDNQFLKPKKGFIKIRQKMSNGRWRIFWVNPSGKKIRIKTEEGMKQDIPVELNKEYLGFEGNVPFVEFDENLQQMKLDRTTVTIPQEHQTRMSYLAYLAGKIAGMAEQFRLQLLMIIMLVVVVGGIGYMIYSQYSFNQSIGSINTASMVLGEKIATLEVMVKQINATLPQYPRV